MKPNSIAIISNNQPKESHQTLIQRSVENQVCIVLHSEFKYLSCHVRYLLAFLLLF